MTPENYGWVSIRFEEFQPTIYFEPWINHELLKLSLKMVNNFSIFKRSLQLCRSLSAYLMYHSKVMLNSKLFDKKNRACSCVAEFPE